MGHRIAAGEQVDPELMLKWIIGLPQVKRANRLPVTEIHSMLEGLKQCTGADIVGRYRELNSRVETLANGRRIRCAFCMDRHGQLPPRPASCRVQADGCKRSGQNGLGWHSGETGDTRLLCDGELVAAGGRDQHGGR